MLYEKRSLAHEKFFITCWVRIVNFSSLERVPIKNIHINQHSQGMAIRFNTRKATVFVCDRQRKGFKYLRCDETWCSHYIRGEFLWNDEVIDVDYSRAAT